MTYRAPVAEIAFTLKHGPGLSRTLAQGGDLGADDVDAVFGFDLRVASAEIEAPVALDFDFGGAAEADAAIDRVEDEVDGIDLEA